MPATHKVHTACSLCDLPIEEVLKLAASPPANELLTMPDPHREHYSLNLMKCSNCNHLQLDTEISMFRLFKNYVYTSNTSSTNLSYLHKYADEMNERFAPKFVVDVGSNDGTFLHFFPCKTLGVDPAENIVSIAIKNGVDTKCTFFNQLTAMKIAKEYQKADLITCNNMFAHNANLSEVVLGVKELLSEDGTFVFEVSYGMQMLKNNLFDLIYHEHFHHWHLLPAIQFLKKFSLDIFDAQKIKQTHGGSIRVFAKHSHKKQERTGRLKNLLQEEELLFGEYINDFIFNTNKLKNDFTTYISSLKGKQISILGYPAKMTTAAAYFGLDQTNITSIYDNNPLKIGKFTPSGHKIKPETDIYKDKPTVLIIGSWNYKKELLQKHKLFRQTGGKFITFLPKLEII